MIRRIPFVIRTIQLRMCTDGLRHNSVMNSCNDALIRVCLHPDTQFTYVAVNTLGNMGAFNLGTLDPFTLEEISNA